jgi:hypothetical protein
MKGTYADGTSRPKGGTLITPATTTKSYLPAIGVDGHRMVNEPGILMREDAYALK